MAIELFVNGTLMRGLALHHNLDGAEFVGAFRTAPNYRLYSIGDVHPGMFEVEAGGVSVAGEIYRMTDEIWRRVEAGEAPPFLRGARRGVGGPPGGWKPFPPALAAHWAQRHFGLRGLARLYRKPAQGLAGRRSVRGVVARPIALSACFLGSLPPSRARPGGTDNSRS